jgi:hypothetical protein
MLNRKPNTVTGFGLMTGNVLKFLINFLVLPVLSLSCTNDNTGNTYFCVLEKL